MRTISLEECSQVAGGDGESLSCPTGPFESSTTVDISGPDGSFGGFVSEILSGITGFIQDLGGGPTTSTPATLAELGFRG